MSKSISFNIFLKDKFTKNLRKLADGSDKMMQKLTKSLNSANTKPLDNSLRQLKDRLDDLEREREISLDIKDMKRITKEIHGIEKQIDKIERESGIKKVNGKALIGNVGKGVFNSVTGPIAAWFTGQAVFDFAKDVVETTGKYETFQAVLTNTYNSADKAKNAMRELTNFAAQTPFQIDELTGSFIKLENSGFKPTIDNMTALGDLASSRGKSFDQLTEAILDAQMGEFERLKEFGIKGNKAGNVYKFTFKGETKEIKASGDAVKDYILSLGKLKGVQGGMNAISKTTAGQISNLADTWDQLKMTIGSANTGPIKGVVSGLSALVNKVKSWYEIPISKKLQQEKSEINTIVSVITDYNTNNTDRIALLQQLQTQYPEFLGNMDIEKVKNEDLLKKLNEVNASYEKRIELQQAVESENFNANKLKDAQQEKREAELQLQRLQDMMRGDDVAREMFNENLTVWERIKFANKKAFMNQSEQIEYFQNIYKEKIKKFESEINTRSAYDREKKSDVEKAQFANFLQELSNKNLDKLSNNNKKRLDQLKADYQIALQEFEQVSTKSRAFDFYKNKVSKLKTEIENLFPEEKKTNILNGSTNDKSLGTKVGEVEGDSRIAKNLTININTLHQGDFNIETTQLKESTGEIRKIIHQELLTAVNDINRAN